MSSFGHQANGTNKRKSQKSRAFGRDLTNCVNNEENSLESIRKEIHDTLENLKKSQASHPSQNTHAGFTQTNPGNLKQNQLKSYSEVTLNGYSARQNFQKQNLEKNISQKVSLTELQYDCYGVKSIAANGFKAKKGGSNRRVEKVKNTSKIQGYLNHSSLRRMEKPVKKGSNHKKILKSLGRNFGGMKIEKMIKQNKFQNKAKISVPDSIKVRSKKETDVYGIFKNMPVKIGHPSEGKMKIEAESNNKKITVKKNPPKINKNLNDSSRNMKEEIIGDENKRQHQSEIPENTQKKVTNERKNPQCVEPYQADIFDFCMKTEVNNLCKSNYFVLNQKFINDKMRAILIDWLIDVHNKFKMIPQTFFMTVNLIDRYLEIYECERDKLQLVGISCLFLSSKYEEIYPPDLVEFVKVCDNTYTAEEIILMESHILSSLNFDLVFTSSYQFHEMFCQKLNIKDQAFHLSLFLLFLSTMEFSMARFRPSQIALSAIYLSNKFLKLEKWRIELPHVIGCTEQEVKNCSLDLFLLVHKVKRSNLTAIVRRFASKKHMCVSKIQIKL